MMMTAAFVAGIAAAGSSFAQVPPEIVRGKIVELTETGVSVERADGKRLDMRLAPNWSVQVMRPVRVEDMPVGRFVGAIEIPQADGAGRAAEVHMFLPGVRMGEGQQPWDRPAGAKITHGDLMSVTDTPEGRWWELRYPAGTRRIFVPKGTPAVLINNEGRENIKVGVSTFILAWPEPDGARRVDAVATGEGGVDPGL